MGTKKKVKNKLEGSSLESDGDINIGDRKVINVYGMETNQADIKFFAKIFMGLVIFFPLASIIFLVWPNRPELWPNDFVASFFCGAFFALCLLALVFLLRIRQHSINVK